MDLLKDISMDVRQLISINEKIHSAVLRGMTLNQDETEIVRHCATQLLTLTKRKGGLPWSAEACNNSDRGLG
jgi:hypothetical protein